MASPSDGAPTGWQTKMLRELNCTAKRPMRHGRRYRDVMWVHPDAAPIIRGPEAGTGAWACPHCRAVCWPEVAP